eukprot:1616305-Alexandrium_andersonii.AAC.1
MHLPVHTCELVNSTGTLLVNGSAHSASTSSHPVIENCRTAHAYPRCARSRAAPSPSRSPPGTPARP